MTVKAILLGAIFLVTCVATNVALQVARKISRVIHHFCNRDATKGCAVSCKESRTINVARQVADVHAACNAILWKWANQRASFARRRFRDCGRRKSGKKFPAGALQVAKKILWTFVTPSVTCNVFHSSALQVARKIGSCNVAFNLVVKKFRSAFEPCFNEWLYFLVSPLNFLLTDCEEREKIFSKSFLH